MQTGKRYLQDSDPHKTLSLVFFLHRTQEPFVSPLAALKEVDSLKHTWVSFPVVFKEHHTALEGALARGRTLEFRFLMHVTLNKTVISVLGKMRDWIIFLS